MSTVRSWGAVPAAVEGAKEAEASDAEGKDCVMARRFDGQNSGLKEGHLAHFADDDRHG